VATMFAEAERRDPEVMSSSDQLASLAKCLV
jgi:hypothetical protein